MAEQVEIQFQLILKFDVAHGQFPGRQQNNSQQVGCIHMGGIIDARHDVLAEPVLPTS